MSDLDIDLTAAAPAPSPPQPQPSPPPPKPRVPTLAEIVSERRTGGRMAQAVLAAAPLPDKAVQKSAAAPLARMTDGDFEFLGTLVNTKKTRRQHHAKPEDEFLGDKEDLELYDEGDVEAEMGRLEQIRRQVEDEQAQEAEEALLYEEAVDAPPKKSNIRKYQRVVEEEGDGGEEEEDGGGAAAADTVSVRSREPGIRGDPFGRVEQLPRPSRAQLLLQEIEHKSRRIARIEQLETRGIQCTLPDRKQCDWMDLPLVRIDKAWSLMEIKYARRGKILKMRVAFMLWTRGLVWGATSHPGPEFLKFYKVRGFDKVVGAEIDDFDDDLEKLYDKFFEKSGEMHPLLSIAIMQGTMLANHVLQNGGDIQQAAEPVKMAVEDVDRRTPRPGGSSASTSTLLTNLVAKVTEMTAAPPPSQPQPAAAAPPRFAMSTNYGLPPPQPPPDVNVTREFQRRDKEINNLQAKLDQLQNSKTTPEEDTEIMRMLLDDAAAPISVVAAADNDDDEIEAKDPIEAVIESGDDEAGDAPKKRKSRRRRSRK